jgi:uncharacterized protein YndB with AHSA1/START domain
VRLAHRASTRASPAQVWELLGSPQRWPEFDLALRRVRGGDGRTSAGQRLMAVVRGVPVAVPVDVLESVPEQRLVLRFALLPGLAHEVTTEVAPRLRGGSTLRVRVVVEGVFARPAAPAVWAASGLTLRVLAARADRAAAGADRSGRLSA